MLRFLNSLEDKLQELKHPNNNFSDHNSPLDQLQLQVLLAEELNRQDHPNSFHGPQQRFHQPNKLHHPLSFLVV